MEERAFGSLTLIFNGDTGELTAKYTPAEGADKPDQVALTNALLESGFNKLSPDRSAVKGFIDACASAKQEVSRVIAKKRDGEFKLTIAEDNMTAFLSITPPNGGRAKNVEILRAIQEQGIKHGLMHTVLRDAIKAGTCDQLKIAEGTFPTLGNPTEFTSLLEAIEEKLTEIDENAIVHYNEIGSFLIVSPGDKLMQRTPPVQGNPGTDIFGAEVPTKPQPDIPFNRDCEGVKPDPDNPNLLVAEIAGQPKLISNGIKVNSLVDIENVDLSTGNIKFDGTLNVKGDIKSGMKVEVTGDVMVGGMVEAADIHAGGNIIIKGGVIGSVEAQGQPGAPHAANSANLISGGNIQVMFAQSATFNATKSIMVSDNATQCDLSAGEDIIIGKSRGGGKGGNLVGGRSHAAKLIQATSLGSPAGTRTMLEVGNDPSWAERVYQADRLLKRRTQDLDQTIKSLAHLKSRNAPAAELATLDKQRKELAAEIREISKNLQEIKDSHVPVDQSKIVANKSLHEGVEIKIDKQLWPVTSDMGAGTARLQNDKINFSK